MGARKLAEFPIQLLSLDAIGVDRELQSRVATSIEYQREFSEAMLRGDEFPPVTVFFDGKKYRLADGFHRHGAAKKAGKQAIRAEIREGGKREALIFSAGANQKFSIPRTKEDIAKAVEMILGDEEGFRWSVPRIAKHVGVSLTTVKRHRSVYCSTRGLGLPEEVVGANDEVYRTSPGGQGGGLPTTGNMYEKAKRRNGKVESRAFYGRVSGKDYYLSADEEKAKQKLAAIVEKRRAEVAEERKTRVAPAPVNVTCNGHLVDWLANKGFGFAGQKDQSCFAVAGHHGFGRVFTYVEELNPSSFLQAIGRVLLLRQKVDPTLKPAILCRHETFQKVAPDLAREIGIEVLTPEEFLEILQREKDES